MTLLDWDKQGRKGRFVFGNCTLTFSSDHYHLAVQVVTPGDPEYQHFLSLRVLCRYLGRGPSEIVGEVQ